MNEQEQTLRHRFSSIMSTTKEILDSEETLTKADWVVLSESLNNVAKSMDYMKTIAPSTK